MEEAFEKLKRQKSNDVENLVKWMKESKILENTRDAEAKARKLFDDVRDANNVEIEKFKSAVAKLALEQKKSVEDFHKQLAEQSQGLLDALAAGARAGVDAGVSAFKEALQKPK